MAKEDKISDEAYEEYTKNRDLIVDLYNTLIKIFSAKVIDAENPDEIKFVKHLVDYVCQTVSNCIEIGMARGMLPISKIDVWYGMNGEYKKEFMYRLSAIGGEPYTNLNLQRVSELLENAVNSWADESFGKSVKFSGDSQPTWIIDEED